MTKFNRFSVQILGAVDASSTEELLANINSALGSIPKFRIKAVSHDKWTDGYTGEDRLFGDDGKEIVEAPTPVVAETVIEEPTVEETPVEDTAIQIEEAK